MNVREEFLALMRFGAVGLVNTGVTAACFVLLALWIPTAVAYTIVYVAGLAFTTFATSRWVFGQEQTDGWSAAAFVGWYLAVYALGLTAVSLLEARTGLASGWVAAAVIAITAPVNFVGGRLLFGSRQHNDVEDATQKEV